MKRELPRLLHRNLKVSSQHCHSQCSPQAAGGGHARMTMVRSVVIFLRWDDSGNFDAKPGGGLPSIRVKLSNFSLSTCHDLFAGIHAVRGCQCLDFNEEF